MGWGVDAGHPIYMSRHYECMIQHYSILMRQPRGDYTNIFLTTEDDVSAFPWVQTQKLFLVQTLA